MPEMLTANFSRDEFTCKDMCGYAEVDMRLVQGLQLLRDKLGRKIHIISGCRCPAIIKRKVEPLTVSICWVRR